MADSRALYEEVILDHNRNPRNFRHMDHFDQKVDGYNPLCGDQLTVYLKRDGDVITDISFDGVGCAISKSSASMMTAVLKGKTVQEARDLFARFHQMVTAKPEDDFDDKSLGKLRVFSSIREYPVRIKCATLPWHTLNSALEGGSEAVSTE